MDGVEKIVEGASAPESPYFYAYDDVQWLLKCQ